MKTHFSSLGLLARSGFASHARCQACAMVVCLAGCADTHWERAFYQGARYGSEQCQIKRRPTEAPCAELIDYDRYEQERTRARNESPPSHESHAIEETQR
jgi:hypothetical protein